MNRCETCKNYGGLHPKNTFDLFIFQHECKSCIDNPNLVSHYEMINNDD